MPALNDLAAEAFDAGRTYSDVVHFVHIYVVEPHPEFPDPSPYTGVVWESWYSRPQPRTYEGRVALAMELVPDILGNQILLIDELTPKTRDNPLWCTYGPAPNSAYLISRDGRLVAIQDWVDVAAMKKEINKLLGGGAPPGAEDPG